MIPAIMRIIATIVLFSIFSFNNTSDKRGTNTYPKDSKIGKSFRLTPFLIAVTLMNKEPKRTA